MPKTMNLSKYSVYKVVGDTGYASSDALVESLNTLRAASNVPIDRYLRDLLEGKMDSVSFTKDKPYCYFFGRRLDKFLAITIKEAERIVEFTIPLEEAKKTLTF